MSDIQTHSQTNKLVSYAKLCCAVLTPCKKVVKVFTMLHFSTRKYSFAVMKSSVQ